MNEHNSKEKYQIVIIDDSSIIHTIMKRYLDDDDLEVTSLMDGVQAIEYCKDHTPDLIFLDIVMPEKDGLAVLRELRETKNNAQTSVIILSSKDYGEDKKIAYELGAVAFLPKPPSKQQIQDVLNQFLRQK